MKNQISKKQIVEEFQEIGAVLSVVSCKDDYVRGTWHGGLNLHSAMQTILEYQAHGIKTLVFFQKDLRGLTEGETDFTLARYKEAAAKAQLRWNFGR